MRRRIYTVLTVLLSGVFVLVGIFCFCKFVFAPFRERKRPRRVRSILLL